MTISSGAGPRTLDLICCVLAVVLAPACLTREENAPVLIGTLEQDLSAGGQTAVLISLREQPGESPAVGQQEILAALGPHFRLGERYSNVPALAGRLDRDGLEELRGDPRIAAVQLDTPGHAHLAESVPLLGADTVHAALGWTGQGVRIAVLDTGIDSDHPDLSDHLVAQHCFSADDCPPQDASEGPSAEDEHGHGTIISGIIGSKGTVSPPGVAPDAEIVMVRVLDAKNEGAPSQWIAGLDWVLSQHAALGIRLVNLSLGTWTQYPESCDADEPALASAIAKLTAAGIAVIASTGNQGSATSLPAPACLSGVIAVGATYDAALGRQPPQEEYPIAEPCVDEVSGPEVIACFTNSNRLMDVVAPGAMITSCGLQGGTATHKGTSLAAATVTGVAALLMQCKPDLTPTVLEHALKESGKPLVDPKNGLSFPAVNALRAAQAVCESSASTDEREERGCQLGLPTKPSPMLLVVLYSLALLARLLRRACRS